MSAPVDIAQLMAELEKCRPDNQRPFVTLPRTREDAEHAIAEDRADIRRWGE